MRMKMKVICLTDNQSPSFDEGFMRETNLHSILYFGYQRTFGNEGKNSALDLVWHWDDEAEEDRHLCYKQEEDLLHKDY